MPPPTVPQATTPATPRVRLVTVRVIGFMLALVAVVVVAAFGTEYYARSTYFVGLHDEHVTIFQGRPGGVLWWKSTISERTTLTSASVLAYHLPALRSGVQESSLAAARSYVTHLHQEKLLATPTTTTPTATTTPTTTAPRTTVRPPTTRHHHRTTATTRP